MTDQVMVAIDGFRFWPVKESLSEARGEQRHDRDTDQATLFRQ